MDALSPQNRFLKEMSLGILFMLITIALILAFPARYAVHAVARAFTRLKTIKKGGDGKCWHSLQTIT